MGDWAFPASGTGWQEDPWQELGDASPLALTDQQVHVTPLPFSMLPGMADAARALGLPPAPLLPAVPAPSGAAGRCVLECVGLCLSVCLCSVFDLYII